MHKQNALRLASWIESDEDVHDADVFYEDGRWKIRIATDPWARPWSMGKLEYHGIGRAKRRRGRDGEQFWVLSD